MAKTYSYQSNPAKSWILLGIPVLFVIGSLMHFAYEWSGNSIIVGIFAPVNESVWEHLKLAFWPILAWWILGYILLGNNNMISTSQWFTSCVVSEIVSMVTILAFYYTYTGALGIESLILDIFSLFLGIALGQILAFHVYKYAKLNHYWLYISIAILIFIAVTFVVFTFIPPHIPLFKDSSTGRYGI
ncbi:MAG: DUF6512 family protein [Deltaproteobacteria bacterium]